MPETPASKIRLLVLDVDGVLTDGSIMIDNHGNETKRFHVRDGLAIACWQRLGHEVAIITGRSSTALTHRAVELKIPYIEQRVADKGAAIERLQATLDVPKDETAVLGDDLPDLALFQHAAYPMAVFDACAEVKQLAKFTTVRPGGHAAVREAIEHLIKARGEWDDVLEHYGWDQLCEEAR